MNVDRHEPDTSLHHQYLLLPILFFFNELKNPSQNYQQHCQTAIEPDQELLHEAAQLFHFQQLELTSPRRALRHQDCNDMGGEQ